ncbi:RICIN domain-containing protein [Kitasatospora sp. NPDC056181]|uniref:RICIN domain-containing protein n=1 Tax=Kitasatospora sp. NPDC056181 TaxID=3345737 RepID=UPI0035E271A9
MSRVRSFAVAGTVIGLLLTLSSTPASAFDVPSKEQPVGSYGHLVNARSGLCLAVPGGSREPAVQLNQFTCGGWSDHFWSLTYRGTAEGVPWYSIENKNSHMCLSVDAARKDDFAPITQFPCGLYPDQYWTTSGVEFMEDGRVISGDSLVNWNSKKCLAILDGSTANTAPAIQYTCGFFGDHVWL